MAQYEIVVTDVTCYGTLFCVAGWDRTRGKMIRPEPPGSNPNSEPTRFWDGDYAGPGKIFSVGNVISLEAVKPPATFPYPHRTEDRVVVAGSMLRPVEALALPDVALAVAAGVSRSIPIAFDRVLVRAPSTKAYVPKDAKVRSLGACNTSPANVRFQENLYKPEKPKLRATVTDAGLAYDLAVTSEATIARWKAAGLAGLRADLAASDRIHLRLGLSRPFSQRPNECYAQLNGLYFL